jgi:hypothetical protein
MAQPLRKHPAKTWLYLADLSVFVCWAAVVSIVVRRHEPWADESQAWLIARDLDLKAIWFNELRYEGTPGLWHTLLWVAQHWFRVEYSALGTIGMLCACLGVGFILWQAPFPRPLRYLLVFSYVIVYQYAVVARSYNLLPLLLFVCASLYGDRSRPVRLTIALILLSSVAVHGILLAAALGICYLLEYQREFLTLPRNVHHRYLACSIGAIAWLGFLFFVLKPTPDVAEFASANRPSNYLPIPVRLEWVVTYAFFDQIVLSSIFLLLLAAWCGYRRKLLP